MVLYVTLFMVVYHFGSTYQHHWPYIRANLRENYDKATHEVRKNTVKQYAIHIYLDGLDQNFSLFQLHWIYLFSLKFRIFSHYFEYFLVIPSLLKNQNVWKLTWNNEKIIEITKIKSE